RRNEGALRLRRRRLPSDPSNRADRLRLPRLRMAPQGHRARRSRSAPGARREDRLTHPVPLDGFTRDRRLTGLLCIAHHPATDRGALEGSRMAVEITEPEKTADQLVGRLFEATLGMMDVLAVYVGDRLGLYRDLRDGGPATAPELATRAGIDERYAREWLEQQAATGILDVDDVSAPAEARRYTLPDAYVGPLLD